MLPRLNPVPLPLRSATCPNGISPISIRRWTRRPMRADLAEAARACKAFAETFAGKLAGLLDAPDGSRQARRRGGPLRGSRRTSRPHHVLCRPRLFRRHHRSDPGQILWRCPGESDRRLCRSPVLHPRTEPHRRCQARGGDGRGPARPLPAMAHRCPCRKALPARRQARTLVPREIGDRPQRLEPALRRDDRGASLRGGRQGADPRADPQPDAGPARR